MRGEQGGFISFGGLPATIGEISEPTTAALETVQTRNGTEVLAFYALTPDSVGIEGAMEPNIGQYIIG